MKSMIITERLNSIRNEMTHIWGAVFILGGGAITLLFANTKISDLFWGVVGLLAAIVLANTYFSRRVELQNMLNELEVENEHRIHK